MIIPLFKQREYSHTKWLETVVITVLVMACGYCFNRDDPFLVRAQFPWIWFGSLLISLRYGIPPGILSVGIIGVTYFAMLRYDLFQEAFPTDYMLGGLLMTLISGQFSTIWDHRFKQTIQLSNHTRERFEQLSRAYFMVRLSHDRLEQNLISQPVTLRDAILDLRNMLAQRGGIMDTETGSALFSIMIHYCNLESAAIYLTDDNELLQKEPIARCGKGAPLAVDDLLLRSAIESGNTAYKSINRLSKTEFSSYLVVAPLRTSGGTLIGLMLVTEMPFLSLHRETLQIMGVLLAYVADHAESAHAARDLLAVVKDCPPNFAAELFKMVRLKHDLEVNSALVMVSFSPMPRLEKLCRALENQQRGLDHTWRRNIERGVQLITLMPFTSPAAVEGYQTRINDIVHRLFGRNLEQHEMVIHSTTLGEGDPLEQLLYLLEGNK